MKEKGYGYKGTKIENIRTKIETDLMEQKWEKVTKGR